jgi:hypothetical protein
MTFCGTEQCDAIFEDWSTKVAINSTGTSIATTLITEASAWVYAALSNSAVIPSLALPTGTGTSPDFFIRRATANEAVYLGLFRRVVASNEEAEGYFTKFHEDALGILENILDGKITLTPEIAPSKKGIGQPYGTANGTITAPTDTDIETNALVAGACYTDDNYSRIYYVRVKNSTTFQWWTNEKPLTTYEAPISWTFTPLDYGVQVRFPNASYGTVGQTWKIECYPERETNSKAEYTTSYMR